MEPYFRYCYSVWGCCSSAEVDRSQKLQNRAARIITGSSFTTSDLPLIESLGWKTIEELVSNEAKVSAFKTLKSVKRYKDKIKADMMKLEFEVIRTLLVINNSYDAPTSPLPSKLQWSSIDEIIYVETTTMIYKSINNLGILLPREILTRIYTFAL